MLTVIVITIVSSACVTIFHYNGKKWPICFLTASWPLFAASLGFLVCVCVCVCVEGAAVTGVMSHLAFLLESPGLPTPAANI